METATALARVSRSGALIARGLRCLANRSTLVGVDQASARLASLRATERPLVFYHWTEDEVPRLAVATRGVGLGGDVSFVVDDTIGGRLGSEILAVVGIGSLRLRVSNPASAVRDMRVLLRHPTHLSISADGRGPYRLVNRRLPDLVRRRGALAVPVGVRVAGAVIRTAKPWPLVVPGLRARIAMVVGDAVELGAHDGQRILGCKLNEVCTRAMALLGRSAS